MMRTAYIGTSQFAVTVLENLAGSIHRPKLVVTMPDRPKGRGRKVGPPPVASAAKRFGLPFVQPKNVNSEESILAVKDAKPDVICVCAYGGLIKEPILSDYLMLNVHPSLLPRWRGAAPIERAIMAGDDRTGVTIMKVTAGLDSGPIALQRSIEIGPDADYREIADCLARLGGDLLIEALSLADEGRLDLADQSDDLATYAEKIGAVDRAIDFDSDAVDIANQVRALSPHIGAYALDEKGDRIKILKTRVVDLNLRAGDVAVDGSRLVVGCSSGALELLEVQAQGKKPMSAEDYLRGNPAPAKLVAG